MYRKIWNLISRLEIDRKKKQKIFILVNSILFGLIGMLIWYLFENRILQDRIEWFICFIGYPAVIFGYLGSIFALFRLDE